MKCPKGCKIILQSIFLILIVFGILDFLYPFRIETCWSPVIRDRRGNWIVSYLSCDDKWRVYPAASADLETFKRIVLFKEDKYFYYHLGVNPMSVIRAAIQNVVRGEVHSGASTITMQVARMLDRRERRWSSKLLEAFRAVQLEVHYSKAEILNAYLSLVPYGGNIEGITAATRIYFDTDPELLSLSQQVMLSIIPNNPNQFHIRKNQGRLLSARNFWLKRLLEDGEISEDDYQYAISEVLEVYTGESKNDAPHFCLRLKKDPGKTGEVISTLDLGIQNKAKAIADSHIRRWQLAGISQYAVLVVQNDSGNILAYLGSAGFENKIGQGEVDGIRAIRSPGSALKPLAYSMAYDKGLITPGTMIPDIPLDFNGYQPENFDKVFHGKVSASFALAHSLNLPAVYLLERAGLYNFLDKLVQLRFTSIQNKRKQLGLSTILGGCGITAEELIRLYISLSRKGEGVNLRFRNSDALERLPPVCSPEAAWLVTNDLTQHVRPDLPNGYQSSKGIPQVAWKTGTSYGRRDAWSIGYNQTFTILVWFGNFDGSASPLLSGSDVATPLLFDLFSALNTTGSSQGWFSKPLGISRRLVCPESGMLPGEGCPYKVQDAFIPGVSSATRCNHLKKAVVSRDSKVSYCDFCRPGVNYKEVYFYNYSPEQEEWMESENIPFEKVPPHHSECSHALVSERLTISTPLQGQTYLLEKGNLEGIPFRSIVPSDAQKAYWYLNGKFVGASPAGETFFYTPPVGRSSVYCVDDKGRSGRVWFNFEWY